MPYQIRRTPDGAYEVVNKVTGEVHARHTSELKARAQLRLLHGVENGWHPHKR
jgi:hypothetical protein